MALAANHQLSINAGEEVAETHTEQISFAGIGKGLEGAPKLKLLPSPWPNDALPPSSATLLSVASRRGLVAAASPDTLIITSTESVRTALKAKPGKKDVIADFSPDLTIPVARLRHVVFSVSEEYLVLNEEGGGRMVVYTVEHLLKGNTKPSFELVVHEEGVHAVLPCPDPDTAHYMAVIGDAGRLAIVDVTTGNKVVIDTQDKRVTCGSWSVRGKAYVVGFHDGTAAAYKTTDTLLGTVPRPPGIDEGQQMLSISYLSNDDFFTVHSPIPEEIREKKVAANEIDDDAPNDEAYHFVKTKFLKNENPKFKDFTFHRTPSPLIWPSMEGDAPERSSAPRYSFSRLRNWEPVLSDMVIMAASNSPELGILINTKEIIAPNQEVVDEYQVGVLAEGRTASAPRQCFGEDIDSALIGEALDLSSNELVDRPSKRLEEVDKSPTPLPAYFLLTHEGLLQAYWIVWDQSLEKGTAYPGLTATNGSALSGTIATQPASAAPFGSSVPKTGSPFGADPSTAKPAQPAFGSAGFGTTSTPKFGTPSPFGTATAKPAQSPFGSNGFGAKATAPTFGAPSPFGTAAAKSAQPAFGSNGFGAKPTTPAFGAPSPFGSAAAKPAQPAFGATGFGTTSTPAFGTTATKPTQSTFGSAGFSSAATGPSGFAAIANPSVKSASPFGSFAGSSGGGFKGLEKQATSFPAASKESSFASTGSTIPLTGSSFGSFGSNVSDANGTKNRERDEVTPTPMNPPGGFKLGSTFASDGTAKNDLPKRTDSGGGFFGSDFGSALTGTASKTPATPEKDVGNASTTPATQPKQSSLFGEPVKDTPPPNVAQPKQSSLFGGPVKSTPPPKVASSKETAIPDDAPLPPDPMTYKAPKTDDDLPPIAGSPPVQVEPPSSSVPSSPLDDEDEGDMSAEEEHDDETGGETSSPSDAARRARSSQSAHRSPPVYPAAPTPPLSNSNFPQFKPVPMPYEPPKASPLSFGQTAKPTAQAPSNQGGIRRDPLPGSGVSLSASMQQRHPPPVPESQVTNLVDDEDERIRRELASDIEPCRNLDTFLARQEYNGAAFGKTGHAAQIEIVYKDINNMVDTLGLNWRSLKSFIQYHERPQRYTELSRDALDEVNQQGEDGTWFENWCLSEMEDLKNLERELGEELMDGRVLHLSDKLTQLSRLFREEARLSTKMNEIRRQIINRKDPEKLEAVRKASLPKELADQQKKLRKEYANLLTQLGQAEEAVMLLKSKLATRDAENGKTGAVPTVDAMKKTISKLISFTEKKSNDIALLEVQFRKVGLVDSHSSPDSSISRQFETPLRRSRGALNGSVFATPPTNRHQMSLNELNRRAMTPEVESTPTNGYGLFYTPEGTPSGDRTLAKLDELDDNDLAQLRAKAKRRREIVEGLEAALLDRGVRQTKVAN